MKRSKAKHSAACLLLVLATACSPRSKTDQPEQKYDIAARRIRSAAKNSLPLNATALSPNSNFVVEISSHSEEFFDSTQEWWFASLRILSKSGKPIYIDDAQYALWFPFRIRWIDDGTLELYSGDVGTRIYKLKENEWVKYD